MRISSSSASFLIINILLIGSLISAATSTQHVACSDPSGVNEFQPVSGTQVSFSATKTILATDVNIWKKPSGSDFIQTTIFCRYILQNPSTGVYNLIIEAIDSVTGALSPYTIAIASDQTFVGAYGGLAVMRSPIALNFYNIYNDAFTKIITIPSTDEVYTMEFRSVIHTYGYNQFQFSYYDSANLKLHFSQWNPSFSSAPFYKTGNTPVDIPRTSTFYFSRYMIFEIPSTTSTYNLHIMHSGDVFFSIDNALLNSASYLFNDHIFVMCFFNGLFVALNDAGYANSHLFQVQNVGPSQVLTQIHTSIVNEQHSIKHFTDQTTSFAEVSVTTATAGNYVVLFFVSNTYGGFFQFHQVIDSTVSNYMEVVTDFSAANEIKFSFSGTYTPGSLYTPNHYTFILKGCSIVKYTTAVNLPDGQNPTYVFSKSYQVQLGTSVGTLLQDNTPGVFSFEVNIVCKCTSQTIIEFLCFSGANNCHFIMENGSQTCNAA